MSDVAIAKPNEQTKEPGICAHGPCSCHARDSLYCSEGCKAADVTAMGHDNEPCPCPHPGCEGSQIAATG